MLNSDEASGNTLNFHSPQYLDELAKRETRCEELCSEMAALETFINTADSLSEDMLSYALEKYVLADKISVEEVGQATELAWERVKLNLRRFQSDLYGYAKVINSGAERSVERLQMLMDMTESANTKPFKETVPVKKNAKFSINGAFQPKDIRPVLEDTNNVMDFYDKVLLPYLKQIDQLLNTVEPDQTWSDENAVRFDLFTAGKWMKNFKPLEEPDDRFRASAYVVRGVTAQGEKALYYSGPPDERGSSPKDWSYFMNTIRNLKLRYIKVPGQQPINSEENQLQVDSAKTIRQRISYLLGLARRIQAREGYDQKLSSELKRLERTADKLHSQAKQLDRDQLNKPQDEESQEPRRTNANNIIRDVVTIMTSLTRLVSDYNNTIAGQLRLIGALGYIADVELKAYEPPMEKPTPAIQEKLD